MLVCMWKYYDVAHYTFTYCISQGLMSDEQVASAPILVLGNKIDVPGACSEEEMRTIFALHGRTTGKVGGSS